MSSELLDSDNENYIPLNKIIVIAFLLLVSISSIYMGINGWYKHYPPTSTLVMYHEHELTHPIRIFTGILVTGIGIAGWLEKVTLSKAFLLGVAIIICGHILALTVFTM
jgi:uncharacterized membrane protein